MANKLTIAGQQVKMPNLQLSGAGILRWYVSKLIWSPDMIRKSNHD